MKIPKMTKHEGDCTIYSSMINGRPTDGICTCGYSHQLTWDGDYSEMYSEERLEFMRKSEEAYDILTSDEEKLKHSMWNEEISESIQNLKGEENGKEKQS